jgi:hypothetical protein
MSEYLSRFSERVIASAKHDDRQNEQYAEDECNGGHRSVLSKTSSLKISQIMIASYAVMRGQPGDALDTGGLE